MEEFPHFEQKYIPLHKINDGSSKNIKLNSKDKILSF